jgi:hypothetical protein
VWRLEFQQVEKAKGIEEGVAGVQEYLMGWAGAIFEK